MYWFALSGEIFLWQHEGRTEWEAKAGVQQHTAVARIKNISVEKVITLFTIIILLVAHSSDYFKDFTDFFVALEIGFTQQCGTNTGL